MFVDSPLSVAAALLIAFFASYCSIKWLIQWKASAFLDYPNSRSLHTQPVPRIGGIGLLFGAMSAWLIFSVPLPVSVWSGIGVLAGISIADDIRNIPAGYRLCVHLLVALVCSFSLLSDSHGWLLVTGVTLAVIWMSNLFNFMDGSDGLAGGMALIGFGFYGLMAYLSGDIGFAVANLSVAAASFGFLLHNFHPARIFLGDAGAVPLGYLAAVMGLLGWMNGLWSPWMPLLIFSPFIVDATVTLIKRLARGEKIWQAHRQHYYQRMVQSGFGHKNTALFGYGLMLMAGASAVWVNGQATIAQLIVAVIWGAIYLGLMLMADLGKKPYAGER
ncbi:UDP-N-acetylmuramyl pentapeptide phosphotransferase/UDP-N-acetylglucosamine-1-phosphate transferase [Nitrosomonas sp. Nm51]|uniref:MraY family glycosyltransferase n=1 Tax=Nitrosomonas sp. Nm51 TaxID=133720 RepID=UPI0008D2CFDC|nr:glycosyltransferase family 4 protein [Nitrosomonas sp. Nm51]SER18297.1 UDP-N-acetylmuramyl pentapeptide phosphotransferase/UDP-N-acetylglucosamine-1-phosphate transferase [Nitrosomonas sp. Nm51]